jgi:arylformamidase
MEPGNYTSILLSYPLAINTPTPLTIPPLQVETLSSIEKEGSNVFRASFTSHSGTHVDAPRHMVRDGLSVTDFSANDFIFFHPYCMDIHLLENELILPDHLIKLDSHLQSCDLLLIRSGWWKQRENQEKYITANPGFSLAAAMYLRDRFPQLRALGIDFISLAASRFVDEGIQAHRVLFEGKDRHFLIFEDMDLSPNLSMLKQVIALPWLIQGFDSAPCTILGMLDNA